ncbi:rod shape-determining protein MreD [Tissierella creatinophila]|uniref:Rod shape-determining protein MreD n=1 Tax=Tissierella creatinophila DSM 6911 TaxID=1123403 RepID=A0A1U7M7R7_TISCR|nr:rod shape-determining protein MreD [Tissierella creatinophila]OLS03325.1 rod shape-determining protein MreD [Tissierella creatinophila DSM 6911]
MQIIIMSIIIIVNLILQGSILPFFSFLVFLPNTALVSVVIISILKGKYYGAFFGLFMGLFQDLLFGEAIGVHALIYFLIGYAVGVLQTSLNNENTFIPIIFSGISTIFYNLMYFLIIYFLSKNISLDSAVKRIFSIEILYNSILAIIVYRSLFKLFRTRSLKFGR